MSPGFTSYVYLMELIYCCLNSQPSFRKLFSSSLQRNESMSCRAIVIMEEPTNCSVIPGKKLSLDVKLGRKKKS
jgi:hypothetical protein